MNHVELQALLSPVSDIAQRAGQAILEIYSQEFDIEYKDDDSPLTRADLASHVIIRDALRELTPEIPLLSEESAQIDYATRSSWHRYWLVDPLDGTKEFINRNGEFTVNIALIENHQPVFGVVYVPVSGTNYTGWVAESEGSAEACRSRDSGEEKIISVRKPCAQPAVIVGSRSHANPKLQQYLESCGDYKLISMGSSLKFCVLAEGQADFYPRLGPTSEWDTAAAHAVVRAAGGKIILLDGSPLEYNRKESLLNPEFLVIADEDKNWLAMFNDQVNQ